MKKFAFTFASLVPLIIALLVMAGCASLSNSGALTLKQVQMDVNWKMTAYRNAYNGGGVTPGQAQQVNATYQTYQQAFQQALTDAGGNLDAPTPPQLKNAADQLLAILNAVMSTM